MPINSQTISNGNGNNMAGRDIINNYYSSDEHIDLYENEYMAQYSWAEFIPHMDFNNM
jgi:hypothetical protein